MHFAYKTMLRIICLLTGITGVMMLFPFVCALHFGDQRDAGIFAVMCVMQSIGGMTGFRLIPRSDHSLQVRDAYLIVMISWIAVSILGALPYYLSDQITNFADALFEAIAGYTTTGASSTSEAAFSEPMILWKAITHWLGGMGILIFIITILPTMGSGGQRIVAAESPGGGLQGASPRSKDLAKLLYIIYTMLTVICFLLLWIGSKMGPFEALINSMGSVSTAGLLLHRGGVGYYDSMFVECLISTFTILSSINFVLLVFMVKRHFEGIRKNIELRIFLAIIAAGSLLIATNLLNTETYSDIPRAFRESIFQSISFMTTSGFSIADYTKWPVFSQTILFTMFFIGGCVASTSGGVKVMRVMVLFKLIKRAFFRKLHPRSVKAVKIGEKVIPSEMVSSVTGFIVLYFATFLAGSVVLSCQGLDIETCVSTTASLMSTTGIAFGDVGISGSFEMFSHGLKLFMSFLMLAGRLEMYTAFIMFVPSFWDPNRARVE